MNKYFDYAASTPMSEDVLEVMQPFFSDSFYNPSALYGGAVKVRSVLDESRASVAKILESRPDEIIFTSGCTEADNLAIKGVMDSFVGKKVLVSAIEHDAVRLAAKDYNCQVIPVDDKGIVDLNALEDLIDDDTVLVSVMYINNEIGTVQPLRKIAKLIEGCKKARGVKGLPMYFHTDAAQAPNTQNLKISSLGVDMMSLSGSKIYGPKAVGCLYAKKGTPLKPMLLGGGQERGYRSGTENIPSIVGFCRALQMASHNSEQEKNRLFDLAIALSRNLEEMGGKVVAPIMSSIAAFEFSNVDAEYLIYELDKIGYMVASGSACHAISGQKSHVLSAIGLSDEITKSTIRISLGRYSSVESMNEFCKDLKEILAKHKP